MSRNHPDQPDDPLLASAKAILSSKDNTFEVKDWRIIMAKANKKPAPAVFGDPFAMFKSGGERPDKQPVNEPTSGIDDRPAAVVQSGSGSFGAMTSTLSQEKPMNEAPTKTAQDIAAEKAKAKIAEKAAKQEAAAKAKAEALAKKEAAAKAKAEAKAAAEKAKVEAKEKAAAERAALRDAKAAEGGAAEGMSGQLREKVQLGLYVKGKNGQLRTNDQVALALETVAVNDMVPLLLETMGLKENPYAHLNQGQQSMNLRNKFRGAIRKETKIENTDVVISLDRLISIRDTKFKPVETKPTAPAEKPSEEAATA